MSDMRTVGIDVAQATLAIGVMPEARTWELPQTPQHVAALMDELRALRPALVVVEGTGGLQAPIVAALVAQGVARPIRADVQAHIAWLTARVERLEAELQEAIAASPLWRSQEQLYRSVRGVGEVVAHTLLAQLPELGRGRAKRLRHSLAWLRLRVRAVCGAVARGLVVDAAKYGGCYTSGP